MAGYQWRIQNFKEEGAQGDMPLSKAVFTFAVSYPGEKSSAWAQKKGGGGGGGAVSARGYETVKHTKYVILKLQITLVEISGSSCFLTLYLCLVNE